jgi:hypothetical protein
MQYRPRETSVKYGSEYARNVAQLSELANFITIKIVPDYIANFLARISCAATRGRVEKFVLRRFGSMCVTAPGAGSR